MTQPHPPPPGFEHHALHIRAIMDAARRAADPRAAIVRAWRDHPPRGGRFAVIAVGKAGAAMHAGLLDALPGPHKSIMLVPDGVAAPPWALLGDHPVPTARNVDAATRIRHFVESIATGHAGCAGFVLLLSGGASALLTLPAPGITLADYAAATRALLGCGRVTIQVLNCIRKHCEQLKGGRLAALMRPLWCDAYVLSDVVGDDLSVIGSGPVAPDPTTNTDAIAYVNDEAEGCIPDNSSVLSHLYDRHNTETPKPGDPIFDRVRHIIVANNETAVRGAAAKAAELGFRVEKAELLVQGDAANVGRRFAARAASTTHRPACILIGGETTVDVGTSHGRGGRNQETALAAAIALDGVPNIAIAAFATDGVDGPTDAAGAIVTGETCRRARSLGLDPEDVLRRHDAFAFFERAGGHVKTGPTGTNVNDVAVALTYPG